MPTGRSGAHAAERAPRDAEYLCAVLLGMLAGGIVAVAGGPTGLAITAGCLVAVANTAVMTAHGMWLYAVAWRGHVPLRRSGTGTAASTPDRARLRIGATDPRP